MNNPFEFSGIVTGKAFCNRRQEISDLEHYLRGQQNVLLFSHRRYGKTSLIYRVLEGLSTASPKMGGIVIDLYGTVSEREFADAVLQGISRSVTSVDRLLKAARELLSGLRLNVNVDAETGAATLSLGQGNGAVEGMLDSAMAALERFSRRAPVVAVLDEFQEIASYAESGFEKRLRRHIQGHTNIAYVFCGSQRHLLTELFNDRNRAFYRLAQPYPLGKIETEAYVSWAVPLFEAAGHRIEPELVRHVAARCDHHPMYIQQFLFHLWPLKNSSVADVAAVEAEILRRNHNSYLNLWDNLTLNQKKALKLVAAKGGRQLYGAEALMHAGFKAGSQLKRALDALTTRDLLEKNGDYRIHDVLFSRWVKKLPLAPILS